MDMELHQLRHTRMTNDVVLSKVRSERSFRKFLQPTFGANGATLPVGVGAVQEQSSACDVFEDSVEDEDGMQEFQLELVDMDMSCLRSVVAANNAARERTKETIAAVRQMMEEEHCQDALDLIAASEAKSLVDMMACLGIGGSMEPTNV